MDDPELDGAAHRAALRGLARIHWAGGSAGLLVAPLLECARRLGRPLRLLDIASGGGELLLAVAQRILRAGLPIEVTGVDRSPVAIEHASSRAREAGIPATFECLDIDAGDPAGAPYDAVTCSLFLHHRDDGGAVQLLRCMDRWANDIALIHDLVRSRAGYALAWVAPRMLTRSPVVRGDALLSVRAAFTVSEVATLAARAEIRDPRIRCAWPERFVLEWGR